MTMFRALFKSIRRKISVAFLAVIVLSTVTMSLLIYQGDKAEFEAMLGQRLKAMAASGAIAINGDDHEEILASPEGESIGTTRDGREVRIFGVDEFSEIREYLRTLTAANNLTTAIYTLRDSHEPDKMEFVVMTDENPYTGNLYPMNEGIRQVKSTGQPSYSPLYTDKEGVWISAYAPILSSEGEQVGILEIDYEASELYKKLSDRMRTLFFTGLATLLASLAIGIIVSGKITGPILHLSSRMMAIRDGDLAVRSNIRTGDELQEAGTVFNTMAEGLQAKQQLLTYVSKAAWEAAHRRAEADSKDLEGETKAVTLLFSDIKGFTPMSQKMSAAEVVAMLNKYFGEMTRIVQQNHGSIDKFIGDAIMAVFEGGEDHGAYAAVRAGIEMQQCMSEKDFLSDLRIRIGVNTGEVVMGDIGSVDFRRDYTCIGDNVNRTQRLETQCTPGMVLISVATHELVRPRIKAKSRGLTKLKGVEKEEETFDINPADPYV